MILLASVPFSQSQPEIRGALLSFESFLNSEAFSFIIYLIPTSPPIIPFLHLKFLFLKLGVLDLLSSRTACPLRRRKCG